MKPIKLALTAFGSYAERQEIDFEKINTNLYMITGKTGAGKTTIFDAIVFAIYGETSGSRRKAKDMHCDLCSKETNSEVDFLFEHEGKLHRIVRTLKYKKSEDSYITEGVYYPPDGQPVKTKISTLMQELIGLNQNDFCQIVMLAQGEFRKFLDENDEKRTETLKSIFNMNSPKLMQEYIDKAYTAVKSLRDEAVKKRKFEMDSFKMPEELSEEEKLRFSPENENLEKYLLDLCEQDRIRLEFLLDRKKAADEARTEAKGRLDAAKTNNKALDAFEEAGKKYKDFEGKKAEIDEAEKLLARIEKAYNTVRPCKEETDKENETLVNHRNGIRENRDNAVKAASDLAAANAKKEEAHKMEPEIDSKKTQAEIIRSSLPQYDEADRLAKQLQQLTKEIAALEPKITEKRNIIKEDESELTAVNAQIQKLADTGAALEKAKGELQRAESDYNKIVGENGIAKAVQKAVKARNDAEKLSTAVEKLIEASREAESRETQLYKRFMDAQAVILADKLRLEVKENGKGQCPVCSTLFYTIEDITSAGNVETISEDDVNEAKREAKEAFDKYNEKAKALSAADEKAKNFHNTAVQTARELFVDIEKLDEVLFDAEFLTKKTEEYKNAVDVSASAVKEAEKRSGKKAELTEKIRLLEKAILDAKDELERRSGEQNEKQQKCSKLSGQLETAKDGLNYESKAAAEKEMNSLLEKCEKDRQLIAKADKEHNEAETKHTELISVVDTLEKQLPEIEKRANESTEKYINALRECEFADEEEYRAFLPNGGQNEINRRRKEINDFRSGFAAAKAALEQLSEAAAGLEKQDEAQLNDELSKAIDEYAKADKEYVVFSNIKSAHSTTYENICAINQKLASNESLYELLRQLKNVAFGNDKYSFERYVLGDTFKHVLSSANERLLTLTDGRYSLEHSTEASRGNAQRGLGIKVLDNFSQHNRGTGTVSGGESFQVSLALALGLSDVVRANSDSKKIDAVFIDEGFGSLDSDNIIKAYKVLSECAGTDCKVGVITHVDQLSEMGCDILEIEHSEQKGSKVHYTIMAGN